ncbi:MAG: MSMEG_6728 family protein [Actinomycetota bacterium]|nr:MSMEG_6728 family protein [Actinomycetota bacterium]
MRVEEAYGGQDGAVQTFLPYPDFRASAAALDDRRLGKQRVETLQVLRAVVWPRYGWKNHPVSKMWRGFIPALVAYGVAVCEEWQARGRADAVRDAILEFTGGAVPDAGRLAAEGQVPPWLGQDVVHVSHQSALVRKEPEFYRPLFPDVPDDLPYVWPSPAFPAQPVRRGHTDAVDLPAALALLGLEEAREEQLAAVEALRRGQSPVVRLPPGGGATTTGLLAGLCMPGTTAWVVPGEAVDLSAPAPASRAAPVEGSKLSPSIARPPSADDLAAMAREAQAAPEFRFLRPEQLPPPPATGLVVAENVHVPAELAGGVPVLTLATLPESA